MDYFDLVTFLIMDGVQEKLVAELGDKMLELLERGIENPDRFATLARLSKAESMRIVSNYNKKIPKATLRAFTEALESEDEKINKIFERAFKERRELSNIADNIANNAAVGMSEIIRRENISLADTQADIWYKVTAEAILRDQSGEARKDVMERAVGELAKNRLNTIEYNSGRLTQIDSAIRRHIITQASQARNRLLMQRMNDWKCDLVFVSAHYGARPDHAEWQGKVYSVSGKDKKYPPLKDRTGYGTVTGLCGANCRHTMTPYIPGFSKLPNTDFTEQEKLTGMDNDQYYFATQKQRRYERSIRKTKRQIYELEKMGLDTTKERHLLRRQQARIKSFVEKNHLQRDYSREKLWGVKYIREGGTSAITGMPQVYFDNRMIAAMSKEERAKYIRDKFVKDTKDKKIVVRRVRSSAKEGSVKYIKPKETFTNPGERREVKVHEVLKKHGYDVVALPEYHVNRNGGKSNIDILMVLDNKYKLVELKCPNLDTSNANKSATTYIQNNIKAIRKQFEKSEDRFNNGDVIGVLSLLDRPFPEGSKYTLEQTVEYYMKDNSVKELFVIVDKGKLLHFKWV